ncbi:barstar family protein [Thiorhodospira sibirica]|uniref:barstar family protein n=1 Tax=Thiorhodospira sibirica TaxID=154347 RepID=UPI00022C0465|nr:barstar family protein [Thiorhodospira sibirica]
MSIAPILSALKDPAQGPILQVDFAGDVKDLYAALVAEGFAVAIVDQAPVVDKDTLLHALYQACRLPAYFGFNWDALQDVLSDREDPDSPALVLLFAHFSVFAQRSPEAAQIFLEIVEETSHSPCARIHALIVLR